MFKTQIKASLWPTLSGLLFFLSLSVQPVIYGANAPIHQRIQQAHTTPYSGAFLTPKVAVTGDPDTLEIFAIYVEFKEESPDNSSSTGVGLFNSASGDSVFKLDPSGARKNRYYLEKHLEFARNYYQAVSNGKLYIKWRLFPEPQGTEGAIQPIQLSEQMAFYNPAKQSNETNVIFAERRGQTLMSFVAETIRKANEQSGNSNPFSQPDPGPKVFRSYLLFHSGHSAIADGGRLGVQGADTPNDINDFFATPQDFLLLRDLEESNQGNTLAQPEDSLGVVVQGGKTINEVMVLSESASQDGLNFGINGILVNQIGRQIGMPDTWDRGTGFTQLGFFDLMDVGQFSLSGFLPVYPSAWLRTYMGWEETLDLRPGTGGVTEATVWSSLVESHKLASSNQYTSLRVPINDREYLLLENRQRSLSDSVTIRFSKANSGSDIAFSTQDSIIVALHFIDSLFLDSICNSQGDNCQENTRRPEGIITSASSYDLGLPGTGVLVWHINEWQIEQNINQGAVNASSSSIKELRGISLVEADGDLSIGKQGRNALGQSIFDFGSGTDVLPYIRRYQESRLFGSDWMQDTIRSISSYGFANANSWNDGRSHIAIEVIPPTLPTSAGLETLIAGRNTVSGDSVWNFQDSAFTVRIHWNTSEEVQRKDNSVWPIQTLIGTHPQSIIPLTFSDTTFLSALSDSGYVQLFQESGIGAFANPDTARLSRGYDSLNTLLPTGLHRDSLILSIHSEGSPLGVPVGYAALEDSIPVVMGQDGVLHILSINRDSLASGNAMERVSLGGNNLQNKVGPLIHNRQIWVAQEVISGGTTTYRLAGYNKEGNLLDNITLPSHTYQDMALIKTSDVSESEANTTWGVSLVTDKGLVVLVRLGNSSSAAEILSQEWDVTSQIYSITASDFDRDGREELLILGSRGSSNLVDQGGRSLPNYPKTFARSMAFADSAGTQLYTSQDLSGPSIADVNGDNHPDILFTGTNALFAVSYTGEVLWQFFLSNKQPVGLLHGSSIYPSTVIQSSPITTHAVRNNQEEMLILQASPDGLIWAIDSDGQAVGTSSYDPNSFLSTSSGVKSVSKTDWPLAVGGLNRDTTDVPYIHMALWNTPSNSVDLVAQTGTGGLYVWRLPKIDTAHSHPAWTTYKGSNQRQGRFDATTLNAAQTSTDNPVIKEFHIYPSPVTGPTANVHLEVGAPASRALLKVYDLSGTVVYRQELGSIAYSGVSRIPIDFKKNLGPDVYTALVEVWFSTGDKKQKFERFGVIR
jgi:M6 family metalloprotease-like protein